MMSKIRSQKSDWILILGQLLAQMSDRMTSLGLIWMVTDQFGEKWVTWYLVMGGAPHFLLSAWTGKLIQKIGALKVVVFADLLRSIIYFIAIFSVTRVGSIQELVFVMGLIFLANCFAAFFNPAILSVPLELEYGSEVQKLTARLSSVGSLSVVIGPVLGIFCFQKYGIRGLFILNCISYSLSGACAWSLRFKSKSISTELSSVRGPTVGLMSSLGQNSLVTSMLLVFLFMNLLLSPVQVQLPYLAKYVFDGNFNSLAILEIAFGGGVLVGGLVLSWLSIQRKNLLYCYIFLIGLSLGYFGLQASHQLLTAAASLLLMGIFVGLANILIVNIFQSRPDPIHVPNIMSMVNTIGAAATPLALIAIGALQTIVSIERIGWMAAICFLVVCLLSYIPFRKFGKDLMS